MPVTSSPASTALPLRTQRALQLMLKFIQRTGLLTHEPGRRALWTDAFAVCNLLALGRTTHEVEYVELAARLVAAVHVTLGKHRADDWREGWLSGLSDRGAAEHPTWGGLRIGKPRPERRWDEPLDEAQEHERDGQYFHYLTKWMHALDQLARDTRQPRYNRWARELAAVACSAFRVEGEHGAPPHLAWKLSIDLSRPLSPAVGQHDALDGLLTVVQLQATADALGSDDGGPVLFDERASLEAMLERARLTTADPLGLGTLLIDAWRAAQLEHLEGAELDGALLPRLLTAALDGLAAWTQAGGPTRPAQGRFAFRELGLSTGLHALERLVRLRQGGERPGLSREARRLVDALAPACALAPQLDAFWLTPEHRAAASWAEHLDVNEVALATALCPGGYLDLQRLAAH